MNCTIRQHRALRRLSARSKPKHWALPYIRDAILAVVVSSLFGAAVGLFVRGAA